MMMMILLLLLNIIIIIIIVIILSCWWTVAVMLFIFSSILVTDICSDTVIYLKGLNRIEIEMWSCVFEISIALVLCSVLVL